VEVVPVVWTDFVDWQVEILFFGSGCQGLLQAVEVYVIAGWCFKAAVRANRVVELDLLAESNTHLTGRGV